MGIKLWGGTWEENPQVFRPHGRMQCLAVSCRRQLQMVPSAINVEATHIKRTIRKSTKYSKSEWSDRKVIVLDMAPSRWSVLEVVIYRVVDWPPLLTHHLDDVIVQGWSIRWRLEDDQSRKTIIRQNICIVTGIKRLPRNCIPNVS